MEQANPFYYCRPNKVFETKNLNQKKLRVVEFDEYNYWDQTKIKKRDYKPLLKKAPLKSKNNCHIKQ